MTSEVSRPRSSKNLKDEQDTLFDRARYRWINNG